jgi:hypothetical protein
MRSRLLEGTLLTVFFAGSAVAQPASPAAAPASGPDAAAASAPATAASNAAPAAGAPTPSAKPDEVAPAVAAPIAPERLTLAETPEPPAPPANPPQPQAKPAPNLPPSAPADAGLNRSDDGPVSSRFNIGFNLDAVLYRNRSFDLFSSNDVSQLGGISIGYAVVDGVFSIVPELGFGIGSESAASSFGGALDSSELDTNEYYGGFSLRWSALSFLEPEARVAVGASVTKISLKPSSGPTELDEKDVSPFGSFGLGVTIHTPASALATRTGALRSVMVGVTIEGGYVAQRAVTLNPSPPHEDGRIPTEDATLGSLERSGPYGRAALVFRF